MRKILLFVTSWAWLVLLAGLAAMGMALESAWKASGDNAWTARERLETVEGTVIKVVQIATKSRRTRITTAEYNQLDVRDARGTTRKLRMDLRTPRGLFAHIVQEPIVALVDPDDHYLVYEIGLAGREPLMPYEYTRQHLQAKAEFKADVFNTAEVWSWALCLTLLGGAGVWGRRKLRAAEAAAPPQA